MGTGLGGGQVEVHLYMHWDYVYSHCKQTAWRFRLLWDATLRLWVSEWFPTFQRNLLLYISKEKMRTHWCLRVKAKFSFETSWTIYETMQQHIPEDLNTQLDSYNRLKWDRPFATDRHNTSVATHRTGIVWFQTTVDYSTQGSNTSQHVFLTLLQLGNTNGNFYLITFYVRFKIITSISDFRHPLRLTLDLRFSGILHSTEL